MKQATYRVETFIIPSYNHFSAKIVRSETHETERIEVKEIPGKEDNSEEALQNRRNSLIVQNVITKDSAIDRKGRGCTLRDSEQCNVRLKTELEKSNKVIETCPSNLHKDVLSLEIGLEELLATRYPLISPGRSLEDIPEGAANKSWNSPSLTHPSKIGTQKLHSVTDIPYPTNLSKETYIVGVESEKAPRITNSPYPSGLFKEIQTLKSIDEKSEESDDRFTDLCYHGCKHGCSATIPTPQEVSEEIFKDNWLQKLETIKQKESALRAKELSLQKRERLLFKRERDVRIMERILKEKVKQVELHLKQNKSSLTSPNPNRTQEIAPCSRSDDLHTLSNEKNINSKDAVVDKLENSDSLKSTLDMQDLRKEQTDCIQTHHPQKSPEIARTNPKESQIEEAATSTSVSSFGTNSSEEKMTKRAQNTKSSMTFRTYNSSTLKLSSSNKERSRRPCKVYYEDLDTTLSADIGDSSFVQTSQKFNPALYRRPFSFARSNSERRPKRTESRDCMKMDCQGSIVSKEQLGYPGGIEQDRILRRVTENISASQDKTTKFQNYGLIDGNVNGANRMQDIENNLKEDKKYSYLNLETGRKGSTQKDSKTTKERPTSWNEGTNRWLRKKREVYNTTRRSILEENKENTETCNAKGNKSEKLAKKKDIRNKLFTVFW